MKKYLSVITVIALCAAILAGCGASKPAETTAPATTAPATEAPTEAVTEAPTEAAELQVAEYEIFNGTGTKLNELYVYATGSEDKGVNYAEGGMAAGNSVTVTFEATADEAAAAVYTVEFAGRGLETQKFETLHFEQAPLTLLSADAMTGATPLAFRKYAQYTVYNTTGATVTELYLYDTGSEDKGENLAGAGIAPGQSVVIPRMAMSAEGITYTLEFVAEGMEAQKFETLHFEIAPISLQSVDATAGASPIVFSAHAEYKVVNTTGATVTELYLYDSDSADKGENFAAEGLADGASVLLTRDTLDTAAANYVLEFVAEGMEAQSFNTLHFETVTLELKSVDAAAGATPIAFGH